ncbi:hypothetical protein [uncultured Shewanella sp.]|uniref:hypothetical protein n=1 Tax=uncultured Shewanella sp. TaxID=173975 RepID=UPI0026369971|nr:hypothetical protein [uncultured Shewanella sp.]
MLARKAHFDYDKASVFAASESLITKLLAQQNIPAKAIENLYLIRYHINASLGYDCLNNLSMIEHLNEADKLTEELTSIIEKITEFDKDNIISKLKNKIQDKFTINSLLNKLP